MVGRSRKKAQDVSGGVLFLGGLVADRDQMAFAHAVRVVAAVKTSLTVLECGQGPAGNFSVRQRLEQWGLLPAGSQPADFDELGFRVRKSRTQETNPRKAVLAFLDRQAIDLLVMANHGRSGLLTLGPVDPSAAESKAAALFITPSSGGFVEPRTGVLRYSRILIPVARKPRPTRAIDIAMMLARRFEVTRGTFTLFHAGTEATRPQLEEPALEGWKTEWLVRQGEPIDTIRAVAAEIQADLIVTATEGRRGFLEALTGSTVERLVADAPCPVLAVPAK